MLIDWPAVAYILLFLRSNLCFSSDEIGEKQMFQFNNEDEF